jgi:hypothetical protein
MLDKVLRTTVLPIDASHMHVDSGLQVIRGIGQTLPRAE